MHTTNTDVCSGLVGLCSMQEREQPEEVRQQSPVGAQATGLKCVKVVVVVV